MQQQHCSPKLSAVADNEAYYCSAATNMSAKQSLQQCTLYVSELVENAMIHAVQHTMVENRATFVHAASGHS
jgi:anti-sigma regulatory factor (Ser/Thr protein kinase)